MKLPDAGLMDTAIRGELYMSFELGEKSWKLTASDGRRGPSRFSVHAGDTAAVSPACAGPRSAASSNRKPRCIRATRPVAMAGGCIAG
jgi:hypothetical protein